MKKRFLIFGAGAIGTYIGGSLALQGHQVVYLEKEPDIPALKQQGLQMVLGDKEHIINNAEFLSSLKSLPQWNFDLAILALKTYHLDTVIGELIVHTDHLPPLLCLQNGVESEKKLSEVLEGTCIIPGTVTSAVDRLEKGKIVLQKFRGMGIAGDHPQLKEFQTVFNQAGLNCQIFRRADGMKWSKLITNLLGNASSAILNLSPSAIYHHPDLYQMELEQVKEALMVMRMLGIPVINLPGVPVRLLAGIVRSIPGYLSQPVLSGMIGGGRGEKMPSFHIDLHSGKGSSEVEDLNGVVVRRGEELELKTPVNHFLTSQLMAMIRGEIAIDIYHDQPELFLNDLSSFKTEQ